MKRRFTVVVEEDSYTLAVEVDKLFDLGWRESGGVAVCQSNAGHFIWAQALILEKPDKEVRPA